MLHALEPASGKQVLLVDFMHTHVYSVCICVCVYMYIYVVIYILLTTQTDRHIQYSHELGQASSCFSSGWSFRGKGMETYVHCGSFQSPSSCPWIPVSPVALVWAWVQGHSPTPPAPALPPHLMSTSCRFIAEKWCPAGAAVCPRAHHQAGRCDGGCGGFTQVSSRAPPELLSHSPFTKVRTVEV